MKKFMLANSKLVKELRKKIIYKNKSILFSKLISCGFFAYANNISSAELLHLNIYLAPFGFAVKKVSNLSNQFKDSSFCIKGSVLVFYTNNINNMQLFPIIKLYSFNKFKMPIFAVKIEHNVFSLNHYYKNIANKLFVSKLQFSFLFLKSNAFIKIFRILQILLHRSLFF